MILNNIKRNPKATHRSIKKETKLHVIRVFEKGIEEAFKIAKIKSPRTFKIKTKEEKKKIIIDYIRKHPKVGGHILAKKTKINFNTIFKNIEEAFKEAGVKYPRKIDKRTREEKMKLIIETIKKNPLMTIKELLINLKLSPYKYFKSLDDIYKKAGIKRIKGQEKRTRKRQKKIITFIQQNPLATQREINKACNTHVQSLFPRGIFEAYEKAKIKFPFERLRLYGVGLKEIRERAKTFEEEIAQKLSGFGNVERLVKTKRGFADIVLERKGKKVIIEVKDYQNKDISKSQIGQLNKYLEDCDCNLGFLVCRNKPKKDKFLIGKKQLFILNETELNKICNLIDGIVA